MYERHNNQSIIDKKILEISRMNPIGNYTNRQYEEALDDFNKKLSVLNGKIADLSGGNDYYAQRLKNSMKKNDVFSLAKRMNYRQVDQHKYVFSH
ncbi:hypothetical protein [Sporosarcina sp.]|uniref:hypothetical protein n=1 Tax=Sporosarcina sp. TaxID=49982 RepID=UPI002630E3C9|nr:hypothetical protein [Sporosarcina sp.]